MHIVIAPQTSIAEAHSLDHQIAETLSEDIEPAIQALIHTEPYTRAIGMTAGHK